MSFCNTTPNEVVNKTPTIESQMSEESTETLLRIISDSMDTDETGFICGAVREYTESWIEKTGASSSVFIIMSELVAKTAYKVIFNRLIETTAENALNAMLILEKGVGIQSMDSQTGKIFNCK